MNLSGELMSVTRIVLKQHHQELCHLMIITTTTTTTTMLTTLALLITSKHIATHIRAATNITTAIITRMHMARNMMGTGNLYTQHRIMPHSLVI
jgi:hypothetical protein